MHRLIMRQLVFGKVDDKLSLAMDHWIPDQDLELLHSRPAKRRGLSPLGCMDSVEWADLSKDTFMRPETCSICGMIVQLKRPAKGKWIKMYVRRGTDVGVCLLPNSDDNKAYRVSTYVKYCLHS